MYTILLKNDKTLVASKRTVIYQNDNLVDTISFIVPHFFGEELVDLSEYVPIINYKDTGNTIHTEYLVVTDPAYKENYIKYTLPVTSQLTRFAGDIELTMTFMKYSAASSEDGTTTNNTEVMHTNSILITILPISNQYVVTNSSDIEAIVRNIADIQHSVDTDLAEVNEKLKKMPEDLEINGTLLQLRAGQDEERELLGEGVNVLTPTSEYDSNPDGITDLDEFYSDEDVSQYEDDDSGSGSGGSGDTINYFNSDVNWEVI